MKLKDTLHLGKTDFAMRANLPEKEPEMQAKWRIENLYQQMQDKNSGRPLWVLHDGPPYANGQLHMGHALNKITKDIIIRHKGMTGYASPYVPGWDTHGLPIESALEKQEGVDRKAMTVTEFRQLCEAYALKQVDGQKADFRRLGIQGDWENPYLTLTPEYEAQQIRVFGAMAGKGYIYKGLKPVYWSPSSESSLAEAEVEYLNVKSPSIYVAFPMKDGKGVLPDSAELVIWTTTPWTLPANLGISVKGDAVYAIVAVAGRQFVLAKDLLKDLASLFGWQDYQIEGEYLGRDLDRLVAQHPLYDRDSLVMVGDHVSLDTGTGLVHTAPGHGDDDYIIGQKYGLDVLSPVDDRGHFTEEAPGFEGMFYKKADKLIPQQLEEAGHLLYMSELEHSYPHDWRTKQPIIFRATPQWFASIHDFRDQLLKSVEEDVVWHHPSGQVRMYNMIRDRGDWVISRQRVWGVPLPIFYAENGEAILDQGLINHVADLIEVHGSNIWFQWPAKDLLPEGYSHPGSPHGEFTKELDIMDVWFDSGTSYAGVLQTRDDLPFPADMYLEGSDQYRGWFNSSFTTSVAVNGKPPYKSVLSQGFVLDGKGFKMSKSLGNVITPADVTQELGADIIRLWVISVDSESDVRISDEILKQVAEAYRKIRNTIRFMLSNLHDFDPAKDRVASEGLQYVDQYILAKYHKLGQEVLDAYASYRFIDIYKAVMNFVTTDLSAFYMDFAKDILYIERKNDRRRRGMQTVIYDILHGLIRLLTPVLVHTMEEAWAYLPGTEGYVQLQDMPSFTPGQEAAIIKDWEIFHHVRSGILKALEERKNDEADPIKKSFEAKVTLYVNDSVRDQLNALAGNLDQLFLVSQFEMAGLEEAPEDAKRYGDFYAVSVDHAQGQICDRCRAVRPDLIELPSGKKICQRCYAVIQDEFPEYFQAEA